jgi:hypothetical protein
MERPHKTPCTRCFPPSTSPEPVQIVYKTLDAAQNPARRLRLIGRQRKTQFACVLVKPPARAIGGAAITA